MLWRIVTKLENGGNLKGTIIIFESSTTGDWPWISIIWPSKCYIGYVRGEDGGRGWKIIKGRGHNKYFIVRKGRSGPLKFLVEGLRWNSGMENNTKSNERVFKPWRSCVTILRMVYTIKKLIYEEEARGFCGVTSHSKVVVPDKVSVNVEVTYRVIVRITSNIYLITIYLGTLKTNENPCDGVWKSF